MSDGLSVALVRTEGPGFTHDLSKIVHARMEALGHRPFTVSDGDSAALAADRLVLFGNLRSFPAFRQLLRSRSRRPRTVLWEFDPLPPRGIPALAERVGLAAARLSKRVAEMPQPYGVRWARPAGRALSWPGFWLTAAAAGGNLNGAPVQVRDIRSALKSWDWLRAVLAEGWLDAIYATTREKVRFLATRGVASGFAPIGWAPEFGEDRGGVRDIDVLFMGRLTRERRRRWWEVKTRLEAAGARLVEVRRGCYGEERTRLLNRSRVLVHLHQVPWDTPWVRWGLAASCGVLVVSEPLLDPEPMRPGIDHAEASLAEIPEVVRARLDDEAGSARMVASCRERLRDRLSVDVSLARVLAPASGARPRAGRNAPAP